MVENEDVKTAVSVTHLLFSPAIKIIEDCENESVA